MPLSGQHFARAFFFQKSSEVLHASNHRTVAIPSDKNPQNPKKPRKKGKKLETSKRKGKKRGKKGKKIKKGLTKGEESGNIIKLRKGAGAREARETRRKREGARNCDFERTKMSKRNLKKV